MTDSQRVLLTVTAKDKMGKTAQIQPGSLAGSADTPDVLAFAPGDNDNQIWTSAAVVGDVPASAVATYSADADLGDGVTTISFSEPFAITGGQATNLGGSFGTPEEQPTP